MVDFPHEVDFTDTEIPPLNTASHAGAGLKEVRERLGWKLPDVAERLRIRSVFLSAIEAGDLSCLPGVAYRAGFVRSYARALGLDGEEILQRFREAGQIDEIEKNDLKLLVPVPDRGVPKGAIIFIAFIVAVGGYGLWYHHTEQTREIAQNALQIPAKLQPLTTPPKVTAPASTSPASPPSGPLSAVANAVPPALETNATATLAATTAPEAVTSSTASSISPPPSAASTSLPDSTASAPADEPANSPSTSNGLVITATQPSWIQVTAPNGTILFSKVLNPGQSWPVPQMPGLKMTTGNAAGTLLSINGKAGQPLGAQGVVLHNYQLTPPVQGSAASSSSSTGAATAP